jgi:hypothetical protein
VKPVVSSTGLASSPWRWVAGGAALLFGLATVVEGGHVLFGGPEARAQAGNIVPFVLVFNFGAGFVYIATGAATLAGRSWAVQLARVLAASTLMIFAAFGVHVVAGGAFEPRTVAAMSLRSVFWLLQALSLPKLLRARAASQTSARTS